MKRINRISVLSLLLLSASCSLEQITDENIGDVDFVRFTASMEGSSTKTMISGDPSSPEVIWDEDDEIGIGVFGEQFRTFKNIAGETANGVFEGNISDSEDYYAVYPNQSSTVSTSLEIELPAVQKYRDGSFDKNAFPMVGKVKAHKEIYFQLLCGVLEVQLTGTETVMSIIFSGTSEDGTDAPVAGIGRVKWTYLTSPNLVMDSSGRDKVVLDCGEGVMLNPDTPTSFYIVLPPVSLQGIKIEIFTKEGNYMTKTSAKTVEIKRSVITRTSPFAFETSPVDYVDLSAPGMANSYVVPEQGFYSFDATVAGNGEFGIIDGMPMFADSPYINPVSAELLWEDHSGMIAGVSCTEGKIRFISTGIEGNALIAAKDADGKILWSWHIWCTDSPEEYPVSGGYILDRALGALTATQTEDKKQYNGIIYQWGRKDPLRLYDTDKEGTLSTIPQSIQNPNIFYGNSSDTYWSSEMSTTMWNPDNKTIYDPCPAGYMVCSSNILQSLTYSSEGYYSNGDELLWFPNVLNYNNDGSLIFQSYVYLWSSTPNSISFPYCILGDSSGFSVSLFRCASDAYPVRCMKQGSVNLVFLHMEPVSSITSSSAELSCKIAVNGSAPATEVGFVYGTSPSPEIDSATKIECTLIDHKIEATISGLSAYTKYYVRAYVVYKGETYYSEERTFYTPNESGIVDLRLGGTSNSYIVPPTSCTYSIPLVKGKSNETVGAAASAELLWETLNTSDAVTAGVLIESVEIKDGELMFKVSDDKVPGNALIALKDASGAVLWSWHIWVVDFEPLSSAQLYKSGALMMDRNLGALNTSHNDSRAFGLMYQWGRKDPFVGPGEYNSYTFAATSPENAITSVSSSGLSNSIYYATEYPNVFIKDSYWNADDSLWSDVKTIYDPCPSGWRVPDVDVWNGFSSGASEDYGYRFSDSEPSAYYSFTGNIHFDFTLISVGSGISVWTNECERYFSSSISYSNRAQGLTVRCMKDAEFTVSMDTDATKVGGTSAIFKGEVSVLDGTQMDASGFILSLSSGSPSIYTEDIQVFNSHNTSGIIEVKATGLLPSTTYYVRAYAKGGHNVRYSPVHTIKTKASGELEGIGIEDIEF